MPPPSPTLRLFSRLTHLHLRGDRPENMDSILTFIEALPKLTHLSLARLSWDDDASVSMLHRTLELSLSICVLIIFAAQRLTWPGEAFILQLRQDLRFVVMPYRELSQIGMPESSIGQIGAMPKVSSQSAKPER